MCSGEFGGLCRGMFTTSQDEIRTTYVDLLREKETDKRRGMCSTSKGNKGNTPPKWQRMFAPRLFYCHASSNSPHAQLCLPPSLTDSFPLNERSTTGLFPPRHRGHSRLADSSPSGRCWARAA